MLRLCYGSSEDRSLSHVDIHLAPLEETSHAERERGLLPQLAPAEQARYRAFGAEVRRRTWLAGRELLLQALAHACGEAEPSLLLTAPQGGVCYADSPLHLNLSHSGTWLAAAVAPVPVGVDIERLRPRAVATQAARLFCPNETGRLAADPDSLATFYRLWTLKEAACKAVGLSVWDALHNACFDLETGHCTLTPPFPRGPWRLIYATFATDWYLAVALRAAECELSCWRRERGGWISVTMSGTGVVAAD